MHTKQELLLGKLAIALKLINKEQLKHCIMLQEKEGVSLPFIFLKENLMDEENLQSLLEQYLEDIHKSDNIEKGVDLVLCRLLLRTHILSPENLDELLIEQKQTPGPKSVSLMGLLLKKRRIPLELFLEVYNDIYRETIACPGCNKEFRLVNLVPGKKLRCKHCKTIFFVPRIEQEIASFHRNTPIESPMVSEETFAGYEILEEIAQGGMGIIYRGQKKATGQIVALKVLREAFRSSPEAKKRFAREAQTLSKLKHPNIVSVLDVGIENEIPYFSMEFVDGRPLSEYIQKQLLPIEQIISIMIKVCDALQYAHESEIIHRDIKPSNILLDKNGEPRLTDFGLAKCMDTMTIVTRSGTMLGTPYYMSPEQARGQLGLIGPRSDLYSLGVVFYEMLTGNNPFQGENTVEIYQNILTVDPPPPSTINPQIDKQLDNICLKCLKKNSFQRYKNAQEFGDALKRYQSGHRSWWRCWINKLFWRRG